MVWGGIRQHETATVYSVKFVRGSTVQLTSFLLGIFGLIQYASQKVIIIVYVSCSV